mmetsp:Transcript_121349/g.387881  ORF Transcript_121349/g.387881 Transcript_121349/m.387881 type:complete len:306 (+) Transcript_121349:1400-2317(+)
MQPHRTDLQESAEGHAARRVEILGAELQNGHRPQDLRRVEVSKLRIFKLERNRPVCKNEKCLTVLPLVHDDLPLGRTHTLRQRGQAGDEVWGEGAQKGQPRPGVVDGRRCEAVGLGDLQQAPQKHIVMRHSLREGLLRDDPEVHQCVAEDSCNPGLLHTKTSQLAEDVALGQRAQHTLGQRHGAPRAGSAAGAGLAGNPVGGVPLQPRSARGERVGLADADDAAGDEEEVVRVAVNVEDHLLGFADAACGSSGQHLQDVFVHAPEVEAIVQCGGEGLQAQHVLLAHLVEEPALVREIIAELPQLV